MRAARAAFTAVGARKAPGPSPGPSVARAAWGGDAAGGKGGAGHGLVERLAPGGELGADRGADEVRAVGVEAFLDQQIYLSEVHQSQVDSDLLGLLTLTGIHPETISLPSVWMVNEKQAARQPAA